MNNDVENILSKLVSFDCLGGDSNLPIAEYITRTLLEYGIEVNYVPNDDGTKRSLHCRIGPAVDGGIILSGHMDVVPVEGQSWSTPPFTLIDKGDGNLYGRGSCDMKGFLACCLAAIPTYLGANLKRPVYFAFSYDEEIGCIGAPDLIDDIANYYKEKPAMAIIGEPTMMETVIGQKGICVLKTIINGSAGHSSRIKEEVSAIHVAAKLVLWLEKRMDKFVNYGNNDERFEPPHSTIHIGKINGGIAPNVIADSCIFNWDIRVIPSDSITTIIEEFEEYCHSLEIEYRKRFPEFHIITSMTHHPVPALDTQKDDPIVSICQELSHNSIISAVSYAAEAGQFMEGGFPSVICGPGSIAQAHRANEYIAKNQLIKGMAMQKRIANLLSV